MQLTLCLDKGSGRVQEFHLMLCRVMLVGIADARTQATFQNVAMHHQTTIAYEVGWHPSGFESASKESGIDKIGESRCLDDVLHCGNLF